MRRYRLPVDPPNFDRITIDGDLFHHVVDVCRQDVGSKFELLDSQGRAHLVEVTSVGKRSAETTRLETRALPALPKPHLILALSVPRFPVLESVLEKAVELGVAEIRLFFSEYSFVRGLDKISENRFERWQKIILSSTQQSGRADLMKLVKPIPLSEMLAGFNPSAGDQGLLAYEGETPRQVREVVRGFNSAERLDTGGDSRWWCFVGSEGGFSVQEAKAFESHGLHAASLGEQVLRVETACITLLSVLKYEAGHFGR